MSDTETERWIAALKRARAELEGALAADQHWLALREAVAARAEHERALLAANPVYRCWAELDAALAALQREAQGKARGVAASGRRRVSLRDVLEHIRGDTDGAEPPSLPAEPTDSATPPTGAGEMRPEPEEATVSFVIREPAPPAQVADGQDSGDATAPRPPPEPRKPEPDAEAEVTIVPRRR